MIDFPRNLYIWRESIFDKIRISIKIHLKFISKLSIYNTSSLYSSFFNTIFTLSTIYFACKLSVFPSVTSIFSLHLLLFQLERRHYSEATYCNMGETSVQQTSVTTRRPSCFKYFYRIFQRHFNSLPPLIHFLFTTTFLSVRSMFCFFGS